MDILLSRYGDISYVLEMDFIHGNNLIVRALEKEQEQRAWEMYLTVYPNMTKESYLSFEDYKKKISTPAKPKREKTVEETISLAERIKQADQQAHTTKRRRKGGQG